MREVVCTLIFLFGSSLAAQTVPTGWQIVKDAGNICQIAVPADWSLWHDSSGAAVLHDPSNAIAIVTSQPQQEFRPLPEAVQKVLEISKESMFENTARRVFYQDKTSRGPQDPSGYSVSVPGKSGTCSGHVTFLPGIPQDTARKIALSLAPAAAPSAGTN